MGQQATAGQAASPALNTASSTPGGFSEDAFRHFRDNKGAWQQNSRPMADNGNNMSPGSMMTAGPSGAASGIMGSCIYTDVTRPNGPMARDSPMDRDFGRGPGFRDSFNNHNMNQPPAKAEASTMMSTAFLQRNNFPEHGGQDGGIVQFKIDTVNEDCHVSSRYADCPQDFKNAASNDKEAQNRSVGGMVTYDEVSSHGAQGMTTFDEPIMAAQHFPQTSKKKAPMEQAPSPAPARMVSQDTATSGFSAAWTSVSQQHQASSVISSNVMSSASKAFNVMDELEQRKSWAVGTVMEVFSASASKWYIAQVVQVGNGANAHMITVQFVGDNGQILQKSMPRSDVQLATFGRNTRQMPPGFQKVASESRPGQFSYMDSATGTKYMNKELAWENYYAKILKCEQAQQLLKQQPLKSEAPVAQPTAQASAELADVAACAERLAAALKPALQAAPTMALAPTPAPAVSPTPAPAPVVQQATDALSDLYAGNHGPDPVLAQSLQPANLQAAAPAQQYPSTSGTPGVHHPTAREVYTAQTGVDIAAGGAVASVPAAQRLSSAPAATVSELRPCRSFAPAAPQAASNLQPSTPFPGYGQSFCVGPNAGYEAYLASQGQGIST